MAYPTDIDSFSARTDNVDDVMAADVNGLQSAIVAIETELGAAVSSTASDLVTRLAASLDGLGHTAWTDATSLTISSGAVTVTQNFHRIDTEGSAATDDLTTLTTTATTAMLLIIRPVNSGRTVVVKHDTGNIQCAGGVDITLDNTYDFALAIYDPTLTKWLAISSSLLQGVVSLSSNNTWTGTNTFNGAVTFAAAEAHKPSAITTNTTLDATHYFADVNATGGTVTITLPAAASNGGRVYVVRKNDASANAVTVDANASETINGALTYVLTTRYQAVTIISNGTEWAAI